MVFGRCLADFATIKFDLLSPLLCVMVMSRDVDFCMGCCSSQFKVARCPWTPRAVIVFVIKSGLVLDPWKPCQCSWLFCGVREHYVVLQQHFVTSLCYRILYPQWDL